MLKKIILAAFVMTSAVFAQFQLHVGGHAAFSYGTIWGENTDIAKWGVGFNAGAATKLEITPMVTFVPGIEVDLRTISIDPIFVEEQSYSFWYIDLPLLARFNITPQFFAEAGLNIGINIIASETTKALGVTETVDMEGAQTIVLDFIAGAGFTVIPNLDINLRFLLGLTNMVDIDDYGSKNMRLQAGVTYWFM